MKQEITAFIKKHHLLHRNATVAIGVSGGPDSMALLHYYYSIRDEWNLKLIALSVDHQLRGKEGHADLLYVKQVCKEWDIEFIGTSLDVPSYKKEHQVGTQLAAREVRYHFFSEQMMKHHADFLALGHHGDDQVETMLMNFVRTANPGSFSGIPVKRAFASGVLVRPLLCMTKKAIEMYCRKFGITPRIDPSNEQTDYTRNYFRKHVIPILKEKNQNIHTTVQRLSESLNEDERFMQKEAEKMVHRVVEFHAGKKNALFEIDVFNSYPTALQRRAYHLILNYLYDELPKNLSYVHEEHFFALLESGKSNVQIDFPHDLKVEKSYQTLLFCFQKSILQDPSFHETLDIPGEVELPDGSKMTAAVIDQPVKQDRNTYVCALENNSLPLHIRTRQAGDRMSWKGLNGSKKVKDIFIDEKIPLNKRNTWPIVTDNKGKILWLAGLKKGQPEESGEKTSFIQIRYVEGDV